MTTSAPPVATARRPRRWIALAVAIGIGGLIAANVHLVYVAFTSQPGCVAHSKAPTAGTYQAAKSAC